MGYQTRQYLYNTETHYRDGAPCNGCEHLIDVAGSDYVHLGDPLPAHHSFGAEYDTSKPVLLTGVLTKIEGTNPRSFLYVDVKEDKGSVIYWKLEGYPPGVPERREERRLLMERSYSSVRLGERGTAEAAGSGGEVTHRLALFVLVTVAGLQSSVAAQTGERTTAKSTTGHWEGDTLVVHVIGFNDKTWLAGAGTSHSDALHVVERYTRVDRDRINYNVTIENPKVLTKPWTFHSSMMLREGTRLEEYVCAENIWTPDRE